MKKLLAFVLTAVMLAGCASSTAATPTAAASAAADASAEATADAARFTAENFIKEFDAADVSHISILAKKCDVGDDGKMAFTGKTGITKADEEAKSNWAELLNRMTFTEATDEPDSRNDIAYRLQISDPANKMDPNLIYMTFYNDGHASVNNNSTFKFYTVGADTIAALDDTTLAAAEAAAAAAN